MIGPHLIQANGYAAIGALPDRPPPITVTRSKLIFISLTSNASQPFCPKRVSA